MRLRCRGEPVSLVCPQSVSRLAASGETLAFAMNAGMYNADFAPSGLYVEGGRQFKPANQRGAARLAAVQALYQMEQTEQSTRSVIADFMGDRLGLNDEGEPIEEADPDIFKTIVSGVVERQEAIDAAIMKRLASGWKLERLDATSRAILQALWWVSSSPPKRTM